MKNTVKFLSFCFLCSFVLFLTTGEAYADNVLQAVRDKAADFLKSLQPLIFLLAGFGLIGFAWMAIFNKISWKWFANIAMGLFLVANMGLFIDYFATKSGDGTKYHKMIDYGDYLITPEYVATPGTGSGPQSQSASNDGSVTGGDGGATSGNDSDKVGEGLGMQGYSSGGDSPTGFGSSLGSGSGTGSLFGAGSGSGTGSLFGTGSGSGSGTGSLFGSGSGSGAGSGSDSGLLGSGSGNAKKWAVTEIDCIKAGGKWLASTGTCI